MGADTYYLELMFFSINFYQQQKLVKKAIQTEILFLRKKRQEALKKKLGCKFIRTNTANAKNGYNLDYEVGNKEEFIDEFKNKKIKELEDKNKNSAIQITNNFEKILKNC